MLSSARSGRWTCSYTPPVAHRTQVAYLVPRTASLGAVLIVGYLGGACAANLLTGQPLVNCLYAIITATLVWTGLWPRDARLRRLVAAR